MFSVGVIPLEVLYSRMERSRRGGASPHHLNNPPSQGQQSGSFRADEAIPADDNALGHDFFRAKLGPLSD
jgi:hypothetical protein